MSVNSKKKFKGKSFEKKQKNKNFWMSIFILVIMLLSVAGFALMTGGGGTGSPSGTPSEVPFQEFRDPNSGQVFWGAIKNSEQFIFLSLEGFEEDQLAKNLANELKTKSFVDLYIDSNFTSSESVYLINKAFRGLSIPVNNVYEYQCTPNTLILSYEEDLVNGECMKFIVDEENAYNRTEALVYHMIKE